MKKTMKHARHIEEIGQVLEGGQTGRDSIVAASWRRCVEVYGMDPMRSPKPQSSKNLVMSLITSAV